MVVGLHVPRAFGMNRREPRVHIPDENLEGRARLGQVAIHNINAFGRNTAANLNHQVAAIIRYISAKEIAASQRLVSILTAEDQCVSRITRPQNMLIEKRALLVVARVVEAGSIRRKPDAEVSRRRQLVFQALTCGYIHDMYDRFVRTAVLDRISEQFAVARNVVDADRDIRVGARDCRIDEALVFPVQPCRT